MATADREFVLFREREGTFSDPAIWKIAPTMDAATWWSLYGYGTPVLMKLARYVLSQTTSASSCERNWSAYDHIQSKKRNRLGDNRCKDLVYVYTNQRLFDSKSRRSDPIHWLKEDDSDDDKDSETEIDQD